jgi:hypothetical protein
MSNTSGVYELFFSIRLYTRIYSINLKCWNSSDNSYGGCNKHSQMLKRPDDIQSLFTSFCFYGQYDSEHPGSPMALATAASVLLTTGLIMHGYCAHMIDSAQDLVCDYCYIKCMITFCFGSIHQSATSF